MFNLRFCVLFIFICILISNNASGYKILGIFPGSSKSHFIIGDSLMRNLSAKGHDVTVISPYPMKDKNYRGIEVKAMIPALNKLVKDFLKFRDQSVMRAILELNDYGLLTTNVTLNDPEVKKLKSSNEKFDVIVMDLFLNEALYGFADIFKAPMIALGSFGALSWNTELVGTPSPSSYIPHPFSALTDRMSLLERIENLAILTYEKLVFDNFHLPRQEKLLKEHFPNVKTSLNELRTRTALVLLNQHVSLSFPRPYLPNMIEVGGLHINRVRKPLPVKMQIFLDGAKDGAIYFSMGSNLQSKNIPKAKLEAILNTFKSIKQRVLWKFENANLPGKSDNVLISDWFPQDDILAHPNVKLFITHGGLLSTTESIYHGKPFIGIPILGDQFLNIARAVSNGIAIMVDYNALTEQSFSTAINEMVHNPKYSKLIKEMSVRYQDQPIEPMKLATYWVEYVARHKGAPHLHCAAQELSFIQYHNIDVIVILVAGILLAIYLTFFLVSNVISIFFFNSKKPTKTKTS